MQKIQQKPLLLYWDNLTRSSTLGTLGPGAAFFLVRGAYGDERIDEEEGGVGEGADGGGLGVGPAGVRGDVAPRVQRQGPAGSEQHAAAGRPPRVHVGVRRRWHRLACNVCSI